MRNLRYSILIAALSLTISAQAAACPSFKGGSPSFGMFDLVIDGTGDFSRPGLIKIEVSRTLKGARFKTIEVKNVGAGDEISCGPAVPWTLFGEEPYLTDKPLKGRYFMVRYENGQYLVHWFARLRKR